MRTLKALNKEAKETIKLFTEFLTSIGINNQDTLIIADAVLELNQMQSKLQKHHFLTDYNQCL